MNEVKTDLYEESIDQLLQARSDIDEELRRHKTKVTIFFTDVVGSTTYFDRFGDTAGLLLLHRHDRLVIRAVEEFQGTVVKTIGDSVMAEFAEPVLAARAAIAIQRRLLEANQSVAECDRLRIRTGINHGVGFRRGNDLLGEAVNVAARITKRSGPGQILVSQAAREALIDTEISCRSLGRVSLEGKSDAEELHEVIWTDEASYKNLSSSIPAASAHLDRFIQKTPVPGETRNDSPFDSMPGGEPFQPNLERYEILTRLGMGGMGLVFKARDRETGEIVALKVLKSEIGDQPALIEAFKNELRLSRKITHKNVCRIYDFNRSDGTSFISMEFVEGESLRRVLDRFNVLGTRTGIKIARQICEGLREAHAQGIVHRDLKPENLMIDGSGNVKLMDFGLAHLVVDGSTSAVGTPSYMAPEQAQGATVDERSDIYALGLVLFEMFTGAAPFSGDTPIVVALKQIQDFPANPRDIDETIPAHVSEAILRCLEKDPGKRFQSVEELLRALDMTSIQQLEAVTIKDNFKSPKALFLAFRGLMGKRWMAVRFTALAAGLILTAVIMFDRGAESRQEAPALNSSVTDAEFAAFRMAEVLNTEDGWKAFIKDHKRSNLISVAHQRSENVRLRMEETRKDASNPDTESKPPAPKLTAAIPASRIPPNPQPAAEQPKPNPKLSSVVVMARVPGGVFMMGNDAGKGDEKPQHQVRIDGFQMSQGEITNRQYFAFLEDTGHRRPKDPSFAKNYLLGHPDLPVVNVNYNDAVAFCNWASAKFSEAVRLPTESEWEYAALASVSSLYPWGAESPRAMARYKDNAPRELPTVGRDAFPANGFGLSNMNGNVWEWVSDFYAKDYYSASPVRNPAGPEIGGKRVVRGGGWADDLAQLATPHRGSRDPMERSDQIGFRIVVGLPKTVK